MFESVQQLLIALGLSTVCGTVFVIWMVWWVRKANRELNNKK